MPGPRSHGYTQGLAVYRSLPLASILGLALLAAPGASQGLPPGHIDPTPVTRRSCRSHGSRSAAVRQLRRRGLRGHGGTEHDAKHGLAARRGRCKTIRASSTTRGALRSSASPANRASTPLRGNTVQAGRAGRSCNSTNARPLQSAASMPGTSTGQRRRWQPPESAALWQLDIWMTPHGFVRAARMPGAEPTAIWRWENLARAGGTEPRPAGSPR